MSPVLFFALLLLGLILLLASRRTRARAGLPAGRIIYADTRAWGRVERPLFSERYRLTGRPDYLVDDGSLAPVEVKSGRAPAEGPYGAHIYQLAAYCLLVAEEYGRAPAHGIIKYADRAFGVDYTPDLREGLLALLDELRADAEAGDVPRSHDSPARCRACGYREACGQALV